MNLTPFLECPLIQNQNCSKFQAEIYNPECVALLGTIHNTPLPFPPFPPSPLFPALEVKLSFILLSKSESLVLCSFCTQPSLFQFAGFAPFHIAIYILKNVFSSKLKAEQTS